MSISGLNGVLAYPIGEVSGDHAALVRLVVARRVKGGAALSESMPSTVVRGQLGWMF